MHMCVIYIYMHMLHVDARYCSAWAAQHTLGVGCSLPSQDPRLELFCAAAAMSNSVMCSDRERGNKGV